ncbi:MAG: hypothetical protein FGM47_05320 [Candidatus Nanopelagicaceae bacterium]|nr:hypothetical protein [Candidatus Nanopelagicaceae bacterium]
MLGGIDNSMFFSSFAGFAVLGVLILLLRWTFSRGSSLIEKPAKTGEDREYGLLAVVAKPNNHIEGEMLRQKLAAHGIKATLTQTKSGPRLFVFPEEEKAAAAILRS